MEKNKEKLVICQNCRHPEAQQQGYHKTVVIINGRPKAGKDTFIDYAIAQLREKQVWAKKYSSIDVIKQIALSEFGWDGVKDEKGRALLCELKDAATKYNDLPLRSIHTKIEKMPDADGFLFVNVREPGEIAKLVLYCRARGIACPTILVERTVDSDGQYGNAADSGVNGYRYDYYVNNNADLEVLHGKAREFVNNS